MCESIGFYFIAPFFLIGKGKRIHLTQKSPLLFIYLVYLSSRPLSTLSMRADADATFVVVVVVVVVVIILLISLLSLLTF